LFEGTKTFCSVYGQVAAFCENENKDSGPLKKRQFTCFLKLLSSNFWYISHVLAYCQKSTQKVFHSFIVSLTTSSLDYNGKCCFYLYFLHNLHPFPYPFPSNRAPSLTLIYVTLKPEIKLHFSSLHNFLTLCCHLCKEFRTTRIHLTFKNLAS
jgi:hypothetical protein